MNISNARNHFKDCIGLGMTPAVWMNFMVANGYLLPDTARFIAFG